MARSEDERRREYALGRVRFAVDEIIDYGSGSKPFNPALTADDLRTLAAEWATIAEALKPEPAEPPYPGPYPGFRP